MRYGRMCDACLAAVMTWSANNIHSIKIKLCNLWENNCNYSISYQHFWFVCFWPLAGHFQDETKQKIHTQNNCRCVRNYGKLMTGIVTKCTTTHFESTRAIIRHCIRFNLFRSCKGHLHFFNVNLNCFYYVFQVFFFSLFVFLHFAILSLSYYWTVKKLVFYEENFFSFHRLRLHLHLCLQYHLHLLQKKLSLQSLVRIDLVFDHKFDHLSNCIMELNQSDLSIDGYTMIHWEVNSIANFENSLCLEQNGVRVQIEI